MRGLRDSLLAVGLLLTLTIGAVAGVESLGWVGRSFPGFLVLENRVVASAGLAHWPAARSGAIYQYELLAINGATLRDARDLPPRIASLPADEPVEYLLRSDRGELRWREPPRVFGWLDFFLLHGTLLFCGLGLTGLAFVIRFLRGADRLGNGTSSALWIVGMYAITAVDLYGPYRFFRLHALFECFLVAGALHISLVLPQPVTRWQRARWIVTGGYAVSAALAVAMQLGLDSPDRYVRLHRLAVNAFGFGLLVFIGRQVYAYLRPPSFEARQRVKVLALGAVAALSPQVIIALLSARSGGQVPENLMSFSGVLFPISMGYAVLKQDLLEVDTILRRSLNYVLLTSLVALSYVGAIAALDALIREPRDSGTFAVVLAAVTVLLLLPLRDRVQTAVDRIFFRSVYDFRRLVEATSAHLASSTDLGVIVREIEGALREALQPEWIELHVRKEAAGPFVCVSSDHDGIRIGCESILPDMPETNRPFELERGGLALRFRGMDRTVAVLRMGGRMSGRHYAGDDRRLLQTLANQGAVAIENALAIERLADLNRDLENKVSERTAELARALHDLRETQTQLVHREKMASLGELVAGVAHEINNPVNFIQGNMHFLREHADSLVAAFQDAERIACHADAGLVEAFKEIREQHEIDYILSDLPTVFSACNEGVARTTTIVRDLRTFSRQDSGERQDLDLHDAIETSLSLLQSRLRGMHVERCLGQLPIVESLAGQLSQVFVNLLANAADAAGPEGSIWIRTQSLSDDRVLVEIEDDGPGVSAENLDRIFDPFFTTKEVGKGTGLGLSISYGIVTRHGGTISVSRSQAGGACFRIELPVRLPMSRTQDAVSSEPPDGSPR